MREKMMVYPPVLVGVILILLSLSDSFIKAVAGAGNGNTSLFLSAAVIQLFIFMLPCAFYCRVRRINFFSVARLRPFAPSHLSFVLLTSVVFLLVVAVSNYFEARVFGGELYQSGINLMRSSPENDSFFISLCYIIIPAAVEELLFRGILLSEYKEKGGLTAVVVSALFFAMLHLSFSHFFVYFVSGVLFGLMTYITGSALPALLLHMLNNYFSIFLQQEYLSYIKLASGSVLLIVILIALLLLFVYLMLSRLEYLFLKRADRFEEENSAERRLEALQKEAYVGSLEQGKPRAKKRFGGILPEVYLSPTFLLTAVIFIFIAADIIV